jgi:hypothetical protein
MTVRHKLPGEVIAEEIDRLRAENARYRAALEEVDSLVDSLVCEEDAEAILRDISGVVCRVLKGEAVG